MTNVYYKRKVEGISVPAIILNGSYYYTDMPVYEDGSLDCWNRIGLQELKMKLDTKWIVTEIPQGKELSIFSLGAYKVLEGDWTYDSTSFHEYIHQCVRQMNPEMVGLFEESTLTKEKWKKYRVSFKASPTPFKITNDFGYDTVDGESMKLFYRTDQGWLLSKLTLFADQTASLDSMPDQFLTLEEVDDLMKTGQLTSEIGESATIIINGLGKLQVTTIHCEETSNKLIEVHDLWAKMKGQKTLHEICIEAYHQYLVYPSEFTHAKLKAAYEAVPEHERMYLGDMDSKDGDFQRILYHPERKREV